MIDGIITFPTAIESMDIVLAMLAVLLITQTAAIWDSHLQGLGGITFRKMNGSLYWTSLLSVVADMFLENVC